ncbi:hypothetical protein BC629DRAFT_951717 [Irpex lacteus]|nr:hypothetical protein BC629DRAFT_951717 [Irpex lacteus]
MYNLSRGSGQYDTVCVNSPPRISGMWAATYHSQQGHMNGRRPCRLIRVQHLTSQSRWRSHTTTVFVFHNSATLMTLKIDASRERLLRTDQWRSSMRDPSAPCFKELFHGQPHNDDCPSFRYITDRLFTVQRSTPPTSWAVAETNEERRRRSPLADGIQ